jgi:Cu/Zn superoxide dismutase
MEVIWMRIPILAAVVLLAAACTKTVKVETNPSAGKIDVDVQAPNTPETYGGTLTAVGTSGVNVTASGSTASDSTMVTVNVTGATPNSTLPWHIHEGKCSDASPPIVGDPAAYPPLSVGADGTATATAHVKVGLNEAKNYIINVHASPTNLGTIVSCGDFND